MRTAGDAVTFAAAHELAALYPAATEAFGQLNTTYGYVKHIYTSAPKLKTIVDP